MGNQNSVRVATDRALYSGGEIVSGNLHLNVVNGFQSNGVFLHVEGLERVQWRETRRRTTGTGNNRRTETYHEHISESRTVFRVDQLMYAFAGGDVPPGQYSFPFSFQMPVGLPGSFHETNLPKHGQATRTYKVMGEVHVSGMLSANLRHAQDFQLLQPPPPSLGQVHLQDTRTIKTCCCFTKGTAVLRVRTDKNVYTPGEQAQILCEVNNQSSVDLKTIRVSLVRRIHMHARFHNYRHTNTFSVAAYEGVHAMCEENRDVPLAIVARVPIPPSSEGQIFSNSYSIHVNLSVPWGFDFHVEVPIVVHPQQVVWAPLQDEQPADWQPNVMTPVTFAVPV